MARLTRQELKKDELTMQLTGLLDFFLKNRRQILLGGAVALIALVATLGGLLYVRNRQTKAGEALAQALSTYHAFVIPNPDPKIAVKSFKTAAEKNQAALQQFTEVSQQFSRWSAGRWARYYAALCQRDLGKLPEAEKELAEISKGGDAEIAAAAKMVLAGLYRDKGQNQEAEKLYRDLESHPTVTVPKATAQIALADLYQKTNPAQATDLYKQIEKENSGAAAGDLAAKMLGNAPPQ